MLPSGKEVGCKLQLVAGPLFFVSLNRYRVRVGPIVTLAPRGPIEVLIPLLLRLMDKPGAIFILFL